MSRIKPRQRRRKRMYFLNGKIIPSRDCLGFVHTAKKEHTSVLGDPIKKGEKLVRFNNWEMGNEVIELEQFVFDHDDGKGVILGVKYGDARGRWGVMHNSVTCKRFFKSDFPSGEG